MLTNTDNQDLQQVFTFLKPFKKFTKVQYISNYILIGCKLNQIKQFQNSISVVKVRSNLKCYTNSYIDNISNKYRVNVIILEEHRGLFFTGAERRVSNNNKYLKYIELLYLYSAELYCLILYPLYCPLFL